MCYLLLSSSVIQTGRGQKGGQGANTPGRAAVSHESTVGPPYGKPSLRLTCGPEPQRTLSGSLPPLPPPGNPFHWRLKALAFVRRKQAPLASGRLFFTAR